MTETMLVRAAGGGWEELRPQTTMPTGGLVEVFGEDIGPVLGAPMPVVVAACAPALSSGSPDAICLDGDGGVWIVQLALEGSGEQTLPQLLACGGGLAGMDYDTFAALCDRTKGDSLASFVEARVGPGFHTQSFEVTVAEALANGRFRLVAIVREAASSLVQSMRFLNATGAMGSLYEATSFSSESVTAVRAKAVDVGHSAGLRPATAGSPAKPAGAELGAAGFVAATGKTSGDDTSLLMAQLQKSCAATFDEVLYEGEAGEAHMRAMLDGIPEPNAMVVASTDGAVVISFEALAPIDPGWSVRTELCQGMERLLGADLGDVRKISQLNLSIGEHLMDATLMEALGDLLSDTVEALRESAARAGARETAAA
ncbi:MAG: hypothetical protein JWM86_1872 [Thermoleophilia bacterium]|nr:hypothetical protein [Thermoleophilia bacterium]